jgi:hypothetical protein
MRQKSLLDVLALLQVLWGIECQFGSFALQEMNQEPRG